MTETAIPIRLPCPDCGELHIDEGEFATKLHHTHSCQQCGLTWRPAVVYTVGVRFLPGFRNDDVSLAAGMDKPWPVRDVLSKLVEAAHILLQTFDYDGLGWELISTAERHGRGYLKGDPKAGDSKPSV